MQVWKSNAESYNSRYYSDAVLGSLHRKMAINEWAKLRDGESVSLERALVAFDLFVLHDKEGDFDEVGTIRASLSINVDIARSQQY